MQSIRYPVLVLLLLATSMTTLLAQAQSRTEFVINGVDETLQDNVRLLAGTPPPRVQQRRFDRYIDQLPETVIKALSAYGYYAAEADVQVETIAPENPVSDGSASGNAAAAARERNNTAGAENATETAAITRIIITIKPNDPVRINTLTIDVLNNDEPNADFVSTIQAQALRPDAIFVSADYEAAKSALTTRAQNLGYFDFRFKETSVRVSRRQKTADIRLIADSGNRFSFGPVVFRQKRFSETFLKRWIPFESGDPFEARLVGELTKNLQGSGYFASVRVRPLIDPRYEEEVPVTVDLTFEDDNQVSVGVGFVTDTGPRARLTWGKPVINRRGHSAEYDLALSGESQSASFSYRIPRNREPLYNYWGIEYGLKNETEGDTESFLSTLNFQRASRTQRLWNESLFLRWERERFTAGGIEQTTDLVLPGISYSRNQSKGTPFTTWGQALDVQLMGGSKSVLSTIDIIKIEARFKYLREFAERHTFIGTIQYGAIQSNDYARVPVSQRFFAGGDRTVRGYAFRTISPRNPEGEAVGGRFLNVFSAEYNYRFLERWGAAVFSDAGRAFNNHDTRFSIGAGIGIRWQSPVGPFRLDLARPIDDDANDSFRVHLSIGPEL